MRELDLALDDLTGAELHRVHRAGSPLRLLLWSDGVFERVHGRPPRFPLAERRYLAERLRGVEEVEVVDDPARITRSRTLTPPTYPTAGEVGEARVLVTGCYDLFHAGHLRFFEEAAALGPLCVVVGHDANIRRLKGEGRPLVPDVERRFICSMFTPVTLALVSTGDGWLDAAPEIERVRPATYVVNEDGDRPEKAAFCREQGIEYVVLRREPAPGLKARSSTALRPAVRNGPAGR